MSSVSAIKLAIQQRAFGPLLTRFTDIDMLRICVLVYAMLRTPKNSRCESADAKTWEKPRHGWIGSDPLPWAMMDDRLHQLVCTGAVDLTTAQRDVSRDWIAGEAVRQTGRVAKTAVTLADKTGDHDPRPPRGDER